MDPENLDVKQFSETLARMTDSPDGEIFRRWLQKKVMLDSYDPINPHNTSRNEGFRAAFREILDYIERGRNKKSYPTEAQT